MLSLVILLTGTAVTILVKEASCAPELDLENILKKILQQQQLEVPQQHKLQTEEIILDQPSSDDQSEDDHSHYGSLKKHEILKLIQLAEQDKDKRDESNSNEQVDLNIKHRAVDVNSNHLNHGLEYEHDSGDSIDQALLQLISQAVQYSSPKNLQKKASLDQPKKLLPNTLLPLNIIENSEDKGQDVANLNDYSKIYIVLNPQAIKKSKNKNSLNDLVSKVLSLSSSSSSQKQRQGRNKLQFYKGFSVYDDLFARRRRDSSEVYGAKDAMEESYKPKRSRMDHGGGSAGRTAIPYIRHRGDIYEREH